MDPSPIQSSRLLIAVTGGTGAQGGSVARHLIRDGGYRVRCVVRGLTAPKALGASQPFLHILEFCSLS